MHVTAPASSSVFNPSGEGISKGTTKGTTKGADITSCEVSSRCFNGRDQGPEHKPIAEYRVSQLARKALQAGADLTRSAAGFAFRQVMNSPGVGAVAPGMKENLVILAAFYNELQSAQACEDAFTVSCDGTVDCTDPPDEGAELCTQVKCEELERTILCNGGSYIGYIGTSLIGLTIDTSNTCMPTGWVCDGTAYCTDPPDEGPTVCNQTKCDELGREFFCQDSGGKCMTTDLVCDGFRLCRQPPDEGATVCNQAKCDELGRGFFCQSGDYSRSNICIDNDRVCDGLLECNEPLDEGSTVCNQTKCEELGRGFLCNSGPRYIDPDSQPSGLNRSELYQQQEGRLPVNNTCLPVNVRCNGIIECNDPLDEEPTECNTTTTPTWLSVSNDDSDIETAADAESSSSVAAPVILTAAAAVAGIVLWGGCAYKSYQAFRRDDPESSSYQLIGKALRHPLHFRQPCQPAAVRMQANQLWTRVSNA